MFWITVALLVVVLWSQRTPAGRAARASTRIAPGWLAVPAIVSSLSDNLQDDVGPMQLLMLAVEVALVVRLVTRSRDWPLAVWALAGVSLCWTAALTVPLLTREREVTVGNRGDGQVNAFRVNISREFKRPQLDLLLQRLTDLAPSGALDDFTCGDPVPTFQFELSLEPAQQLRERGVSVVSVPNLDVVKDRCLYSGLTYSVDLALADIDIGTPIDYGYHDSRGKPLEPWAPGHVARKPVCRCDLRESGREWVAYSDEWAAALK